MSMKELMESLETLGGRIRADAEEPKIVVSYEGAGGGAGARPVANSVSVTYRSPRCAWRQYSDQLSCSTCGRTWDIGDQPDTCPEND